MITSSSLSHTPITALRIGAAAKMPLHAWGRISTDVSSRSPHARLGSNVNRRLGTISPAMLDYFDESDPHLTQTVSALLAAAVHGIFPSELPPGGLHCSAAVADSAPFVTLLHQCMGPYYVRHHGALWKHEKAREMAEPGLVYVWYGAGSSSPEPRCFLSCKVVSEPVGPTLYLYEIQVAPEFQGQGVGAALMRGFHRLAASVREVAVVATGLTVFSDNSRALQWYTTLGYRLALDSPSDKNLRGGRIAKPSFYILTRPLDGI